MPFDKKEWSKIYYQKNREKYAAYGKKYHDENKEKRNENTKRNYQKNKIKYTEYQKEYSKTSKGLKIHTFGNWKTSKLIGDYEMLYKIYLSTKFCDECGFELNTGDNRMRKCLDHCHKTGIFRNILCMSCNIKRG
tara:strand:- start:67 stop:471 length:405 start_codon:yes stop_codon:yes gene_type:complete